MRAATFSILVLIAAVLAGGYFYATQKNRGLSSNPTELPRKLEASKAAEAGSHTGKPVTDETGGETNAGTSDVHQDHASAKAFGGMLSKMLEDPQTRSFIRDQQRAMVEQLYGPLLARLNLTPQQSARVTEVLLDHLMDSAVSATASLTEDGQPPAQDLQKALDDKMRQLLTEEQRREYEQYSATLQERAQLIMFRQETGITLDEEQTAQMLRVMQEAKAEVAAESKMPSPVGPMGASGVDALRSRRGAESMIRMQEAISARVYERASGILAAEQLAAFGAFQTNQIRTIRTGLKLMREMLSPAPGAAEK